MGEPGVWWRLLGGKITIDIGSTLAVNEWEGEVHVLSRRKEGSSSRFLKC